MNFAQLPRSEKRIRLTTRAVHEYCNLWAKEILSCVLRRLLSMWNYMFFFAPNIPIFIRSGIELFPLIFIIIKLLNPLQLLRYL